MMQLPIREALSLCLLTEPILTPRQADSLEPIFLITLKRTLQGRLHDTVIITVLPVAPPGTGTTPANQPYNGTTQAISPRINYYSLITPQRKGNCCHDYFRTKCWCIYLHPTIKLFRFGHILTTRFLMLAQEQSQ